MHQINSFHLYFRRGHIHRQAKWKAGDASPMTMEMAMFGTMRAGWTRIGFGAADVAPLWATLALWRALRRERRMLGTLDARLLRDIGVDAGDAEVEAARRFWDVPANR